MKRQFMQILAVGITAMSETATRKTVVRNGREVDALDFERVQSIYNGLQVLSLSLVGQLVKNIKVTGNGTFIPAQPSPKDASKTMPAKWVYNTNFRSEVALDSPRVKEAYEKAMAAEAAGDTERTHDAWRDFLNYVTVSFNTPAAAGQDAPFIKGQLVQGLVAHVQTDNGQLVRFESVSAMKAVTASKAAVDLKTLFAPKAETSPAGGGSKTPAKGDLNADIVPK